jgi:hypothetical protein
MKSAQFAKRSYGGALALLCAVALLPVARAQCATGKFSADGNTNCAECEIGYFQNVVGQTSCKACNPGEYQDLKGQAICKAGSTCTTTQRVNALATGCETCKLRQITDSGAIKVCIDCTSYTGACEKTNCDYSGIICADINQIDNAVTRTWNFGFDEAWD